MKRFLTLLEMVKFEHTVFAFPFAYLGAFLAARGFPGWSICFWILLAMVGARSAAMAFNRLVDLPYDQLNPRTIDRALPRKLVSRFFVVMFIVGSALTFLLSAWMLNSLAFLLAPPALAIILGYSYSKRFTSLSHLLLGLSLSIAPVGGWIAVRAQVELAPFYLAAAVLFWVAGFDIIYACQDVEFDRETGLCSMPRRMGIRSALRWSAGFHILTVGLLCYVFLAFRLSLLSWVGLAVAVSALIFQHHLVGPEDLSRVNAAFFVVNGFISVVLFLFVGVDLCLFV